MSLKNEAQAAYQNTKLVYKEYVTGMTRERIGQEFFKDTDRLRQLYEEAISRNQEVAEKSEDIPGHLKFLRLFSELTQRRNPTRRLLFGLSLVAFLIYYFFSFVGVISYVPFYNLLVPFAFASMLMLLLVELLEKSEVKQEIDLARQIQLSLLPSTEQQCYQLEISSFANTAREVGGDYVDTIKTAEGTYVIIADVSGKGLAAALYMARLQALVHLLVERDAPTPQELFLQLNDYVKSDNADRTFVTACAAYFPKEKNHFTFARAGHNIPILYNKKRDATFDLGINGYALGMTSTANMKHFLEEKKFQFNPGDSLLFYTDGLSEARNEVGEEYGRDRLDAIMSIYGSLHAQTMVHKFQSSLEAFIGMEEPDDDITFTCVHHSR